MQLRLKELRDDLDLSVNEGKLIKWKERRRVV